MTDTSLIVTAIKDIPEPTVTITLTKQELIDIRVAVLHRMNILMEGSLGERGEPYQRIRAMMESPDGVLLKALYTLHTIGPRDVV